MEWTPSAGADHYALVDDDPDAPNVADYVTSPANPVGAAETFVLTPVGSSQAATLIRVKAYGEAGATNAVWADVYVNALWLGEQQIIPANSAAGLYYTDFVGSWTAEDFGTEIQVSLLAADDTQDSIVYALEVITS